MKNTGIVRRIDELGRVVIPKEIRKVLRIRDGEPLEIYVEGEKISLKKFSLIDSYKDLAKTLVEEVGKVIDKTVFITNRDEIITCYGDLKKDILNQEISSYLEKIIKERKTVVQKTSQNVEFVKNIKNNCAYLIHPIITEGNIVGLVVICSSKSSITETDEKLAITCSQFLEKYIEE